MKPHYKHKKLSIHNFYTHTKPLYTHNFLSKQKATRVHSWTSHTDPAVWSLLTPEPWSTGSGSSGSIQPVPLPPERAGWTDGAPRVNAGLHRRSSHNPYIRRMTPGCHRVPGGRPWTNCRPPVQPGLGRDGSHPRPPQVLRTSTVLAISFPNH